MLDRFPVIDGAEPWSSPGRGPRTSIGIVVVHGFTGNPNATRPLGEALARKGFAVEVVRLPGHGTHWRDLLRMRYGDWRWEVERAVNALARAGKRVVVVGLSMGGTIALDLAAASPETIAGIVPINPTVLDREGLLAKAAPILELILPVVPASAAGLVKNDIAKGGDEKAYDIVPSGAGNSLLQQLRRIRDGIAGLTVPVLVAYSPGDHSVPPESSRALLRMLAEKDATELVLERSFHVATLDLDFDLLLERITAFADRVGHPS